MIINPKQIEAEKIVENINEGKFEIQQNGIDLTLESASLINGGALGVDDKKMKLNTELEMDRADYFAFHPGHSYAIEFQQKVAIPENMCAQIVHRSTLNRMGAFIISGLYDSGFKNQIGAVLRTTAPVEIQKGARVAQIFFHEADSASMYDGQYQKGK